MRRAAAAGFAAPKLLTMLMPWPAAGIVIAGQLGQRQRALGQGFENQRAAALGGQRAHHRGGAVAAVAGEAGGAADKQGRLRHKGSSRP
ncbi:hypothetical protein G6F59_017962 [Rhizopus arrhizus]|nr:hypothetical protein G6F59_017962 [Rhizopus arrhizus]